MDQLDDPNNPSGADSPRWQRRPAERRREILEAAVMVFGEYGFDCTTMAEVAKRAGVSSGTVSHYFGSKGELFEATLAERFLEEVAWGEALLASHRGPPRDLLRQLLTRLWQHLMRPGTTNLMVCGLAKAQDFPEAASMLCRETGERWRRLLGAVLSAGIESGEFRRLDVLLQARVISAGLKGLALAIRHFSRFESQPPNPDVLFQHYLETLDHSLAAAPLAQAALHGDGV